MAIALFGSGIFVSPNAPAAAFVPRSATARSTQDGVAEEEDESEQDGAGEDEHEDEEEQEQDAKRGADPSTASDSAQVTTRRRRVHRRRWFIDTSEQPTSTSLPASTPAPATTPTPSHSHCQLSEFDLRLCAINFCSLHIVLALLFIAALFFELSLVTEQRHSPSSALYYSWWQGWVVAHMVLVMLLCALIGGVLAWAATVSLGLQIIAAGHNSAAQHLQLQDVQHRHPQQQPQQPVGAAAALSGGPLAAALSLQGGDTHEIEQVLGLTPLSRALRHLATIARAAEIHSAGRLLSYHAVVSFARKVYGYLAEDTESHHTPALNQMSAGAAAPAYHTLPPLLSSSSAARVWVLPCHNSCPTTALNSIADCCATKPTSASASQLLPPSLCASTTACVLPPSFSAAAASGMQVLCTRRRCGGRHCPNGHCQSERGVCRRTSASASSALTYGFAPSASSTLSAALASLASTSSASAAVPVSVLLPATASTSARTASLSSTGSVCSMMGGGSGGSAAGSGSAAQSVGATVGCVRAAVLEAFIHELEVEVRAPFAHYIRLLHRHALAVRCAHHIRVALTQLQTMHYCYYQPASSASSASSASANAADNSELAPRSVTVTVAVPCLPPELIALIVDYRLGYPHRPPRATASQQPLQPLRTTDVYEVDPDAECM
jgi:hypothetical protein